MKKEEMRIRKQEGMTFLSFFFYCNRENEY
jgi:hypothetical protein